MVNLQSKRAALVVMQPGRLLEDGTFERRVRMIRPLTHSTTSEPELLKSTWQETDAHAWQVTWDQEARGAPPTRESKFWMMTGLLLPVWHRLPRTDVKVYRLATDDGENIIGRVVNASQVNELRASIALDAAAPAPTRCWDEQTTAAIETGAPIIQQVNTVLVLDVGSAFDELRICEDMLKACAIEVEAPGAYRALQCPQRARASELYAAWTTLSDASPKNMFGNNEDTASCIRNRSFALGHLEAESSGETEHKTAIRN